jgi:competence protein ComEC
MNSTTFKNRRFLLSVVVLSILIGLRMILSTPNTDINSIGKTYNDMGKSAKFFPRITNSLSSKVDELYPPLPAQLVKGLVLGVDEIDREFKDVLISTGTIHVVVVSGFNISLVGSALLSLSRFVGRKKALVVSFVGIVLYTLITGAEPPTVRAAIMGSLAFGAQGLGRQKESTELLILAALVMLVFDPLLFTDLSFQLSVLATFGIIEFAPRLTKRMRRFGILKTDLANTLGAQALVVPLLFFNFGQVSWISPLVNVLVLWTVPIATILGFISLALGFILLPLGVILSWFNLVFLTMFILVVEAFKGVPTLNFGEANWLLFLGYYLLLVGVIMTKGVREKPVRG